MSSFRAVLFDWRGTLFHDESNDDWNKAAAKSIGRHLSADELAVISKGITEASALPEVRDAWARADCSVELNREAALLHFRLAGIDDDLARAMWLRDGTVGTSFPYPDAPDVLRALKQRGLKIAIVSDIHFPLQPHFAAFGLDDCVDFYALSFEHGFQKPDPRLFRVALEGLGVEPAEALMVGDRASRDAGAVDVGIPTLILPPAPDFAVRGLSAVLNLVGHPDAGQQERLSGPRNAS